MGVVAHCRDRGTRLPRARVLGPFCAVVVAARRHSSVAAEREPLEHRHQRLRRGHGRARRRRSVVTPGRETARCEYTTRQRGGDSVTQTQIVGNVFDIGFDGVDGTLWLASGFRATADGVVAPVRRKWEFRDGELPDTVLVEPGPAVMEIDVGVAARGLWEVVVPDDIDTVTLRELVHSGTDWSAWELTEFQELTRRAEGAAATAEDEADRAEREADRSRDEANRARDEQQQAGEHRDEARQARDTAREHRDKALEHRQGASEAQGLAETAQERSETAQGESE